MKLFNRNNRIVLAKGQQRNLVLAVKTKNQITWKELARKLSLGENYLKNEIRNETRTLDERVFHNLCILAHKKPSEMTFTSISPTWGQQKGGRKSKTLPKKPKKLTDKQTEKLAESLGIMAGDGSVYVRENKGLYQITVAGNKITDKLYLDYVSQLFQDIFGIRFGLKISKTKNAVWLFKQSKDLWYTLECFGIKAGNKKKNNLRIPRWIWSDEKFLKAFIRGLIDTDGSVYFKSAKHKTPVITFKSGIDWLRKDFTRAMQILDFTLSPWSKNGTPQTSIYRKEEVGRFVNEIGFNNPKHENKLLLRSSSPVKRLI